MFKIPEIIFRYFSFCLSLVAALSISIQAAKPLEGSLGKSKEHFLENKGQIHYSDGKPADNVCFVLDRGETKIFILRDGGIAYQTERKHYPKGFDAMWKPNMGFQNPYHLDSLMQLVQTETYRMDMKLLGANLKAEIIKEGKSLDYIHYYNHNVLQVHHYERLLFKEIYPGIDWIIYTTEQGFKYDFLVKPGANVGQIKMLFTGQEELKLDRQGNLLHRNRLARFIEEKPVSYQGKRDIQTNFILKDSIVEFEVSNYDKTQPLTIDPNRIWGTYYGGIGDDFAQKSVTSGNKVYVSGYSSSSSGIAHNGHQITIGGGYDAFLLVLNFQGQRLWASYYGGPNDDYGKSVAVDALGNIFLAGYTRSATGIGFGNTSAPNQISPGQYDAFLAKFDSNGNRLWGTYFGELAGDYGNHCAVDLQGNVYLTGSVQASSYPQWIALNGFQNSYGGGTDAFLAKFNSNGIKIWGTFYGGSNYDEGINLRVDGNSFLYLVGTTGSSNNIASANPQSIYSGSFDGFIVKFNLNGGRIWGRYYGGIGNDRINGVDIDALGNIYICGYTYSGGLGHLGYQNNVGGGLDGIFAKFNSSGTILWSSYLGGPQADNLTAIKITPNNNLMVTGTFSSSGLALNGSQSTLNGVYDSYIAKFNANCQVQWSSYFGGASNEGATDICLSGDSVHFVIGYTNSSDVIPLKGHQMVYSGNADAFIAKFKSCPTLNLNLGSPSSYCIGDTIILSSQGASIYAWTGPAGFSSNLSQPSILNAQLGMTGYYKIEATDAFGCQSKDSVLVVVHPLPLVTITGPASYCEGDTIQLLGQGAINYSWTLPSGSSIPTDSLTILNSLASNSGTVILFGTDSNQCSNTDSLAIIVTPYPNAQVNNIGSICPGASFTLLGGGGTHFLWSGPNGFSSSISNPTLANVSQINAGIYQVIVSQGIGCSDTAFVPVFLHTNPVITATNTGPYCSGDSIQAFSSGAQNYSWSGPNGFAASGSSIVIPQSQPIDSGEYYVIGTDSNGCSDTTSTQILVVANPIVQINSSLDEEFCQGLSTLLQATGAQNYTWNTGQANPSIWVQQSGTYNCIGIDSNGCSSLSNSVNINVVPLPYWLTPPQNLVELPGQTATLVAIAANANFYQWESLISGFFQPLQDTGQYSGTQTQVLSVANLNTHNHGQQFRCIASNNLCQDSSSVAALFLSGNQSNEKESSSSHVYPNPATTLLHLKISLASPFNYTVKDQLGRLVLKSISQNQEFSISIETWPTGWYTFTAGDINILFGKIN